MPLSNVVFKLKSAVRRLVLQPVPALVCLGLPVFIVNYFAGRPGISGWDANLYYAYAGAIAETGRVDLGWAYAEMVKRGADPTVFDFRRLTRMGRPYNYFPIGHPLLHVPAVLLGRWVSGAFESRGFSAFGPTAQLLYCLSCIGAGALGLGLVRRRVSALLGDEAAGVGLLSLFAVSMLGYYWFVLPALSHTSSLLMAALVVGAFWRAAGDGVGGGRPANDAPQSDPKSGMAAEGGAGPAWAFGALGLATGYMAAVRLQDVVFGAFGVVALWTLVRRSLALRRILVRAVLLGAGVVLGFLPQMLLWRWKDGSWIYLGYHELYPERYYFSWARPQLWNVLFSARHGLFFWHPGMLAAFAGFVMWLWGASRPVRIAAAAEGLPAGSAVGGGRAALGWALLLSFLGLWYVGGSFSVWWFGDSFGSRPFLSVLPLFWIGAAWLWTRVRGRPVLAMAYWAVVAVLGAMNVLLALLYHLGRIPRGDALTLEIVVRGLGF
ncbi:MAG: hypothetical protein Kow0059_19270 [Candidatus Sumerlaeia bacterium]